MILIPSAIGQSHNRGRTELIVCIKIFSILGFAWAFGLATLPFANVEAEWASNLVRVCLFGYILFHGLQVGQMPMDHLWLSM